MTVTIVLLPLRVKLDHSINTHDGNAGLDSTLELFNLAHAGFQHTSFEAVMDTTLHQIETVILIGLFLGNSLLFLVRIAFLYALRDGVTNSELGNEFRGVFRGVDGEGLGDDKERLSEFADGELFTGTL